MGPLRYMLPHDQSSSTLLLGFGFLSTFASLLAAPKIRPKTTFAKMGSLSQLHLFSNQFVDISIPALLMVEHVQASALTPFCCWFDAILYLKCPTVQATGELFLQEMSKYQKQSTIQSRFK